MSLASPALQEWQRSGKFFNHRGLPIFYKTSGQISASAPSAQRLLLIHGFPTASWDWAKLWQPLAEHFELITLDMLGFGFSAKPLDFAYSIKAQADLFEALLQHLGVDRCHVLAHDYGNSVAQELLARQLDKTASVALDSVCFLNGGLFPEAHHPLLIQKLLLSPLGPLVARLSNRRSFAVSLRKIFGPETPPSSEELAGFWQLVTQASGLQAMPKLIRYMPERRQNRERWVGAVVNSPVPVRLIDGMLDPISGAHLVARYRQLVPKPDVVELARVGHYPQVEAPKEVLSGFLKFHGLNPGAAS